MLNQKEEKIMQLVRMSGPVLPSAVAKNIETEVYLASAMLSVLVNNGHLKLSSRKVGSSPLYYISGQENMVRTRLHKELNDLEKKALERVKELKIAFPNDLFPQERVLIKDLKDFVEHLTLKVNDQEIDMWRHYSVSDEDMQKMIDEKLNPKEQVKTEMQKTETPEPAEQTPQPEPEKPEPQPVQRKKRAPSRISSDFEKKIEEYLDTKDIEIVSTKHPKRGEILHEALVSTTLGQQNFLIKIKKKARIDESDISSFYTECLSSKKPGILFVPSKLTKRTRDFVLKHIGDLIKVIVI